MATKNTPETKLANSGATAAPSKVIPGTEPIPAVNASADDFENPSVGEMFGGSYIRLELTEGQASPLLEYVKDSKVQVENDNGTEMISAPVVKNEEDGKLYSLPISAIFRKHFKEANLNPGDKFRFKRYTDAVKKRGKGAGNKLRVYAVKVYSRKETAAPAASAE